MKRSADEPRIAYLLDRFPSPSQTFVANEIAGVRDCGADLVVLALRGAGAGAHRPAARAPGLVERAKGLLKPPVAALGLERPRLLQGLQLAWHLGTARHFGSLLRRLGVGHVHAHFASLPTGLALLVARHAPVTVSFSAHARDVFVTGASLGERLARARLCIACCDATARRIRELARPLDHGKVRRIYHGTDLDAFSHAPRAEVADPPLVLAAGRFVPKKGFDCLLRACAILRSRRRIRCRIVGSGAREGELRALALRLQLGDAVSFSPWVPYERMPGQYREADVLAAPSVEGAHGDRDGLPNVVVEALAAGLPVVGSQFAGIPEAVRHQRTGLLCRPGDPEALADALDRMLGDAELRARVTRDGRRLAEELFDYRENARMVHQALLAAAR